MNTAYHTLLRESAEATLALAKLEAPFTRAVDALAETLCSGHKLLACGNGGSAADSAHFTTEFLCRFCEDRRPYPALALASEGSLLCAIGNDYHFDEVFSRQIQGLAVPGDLVAVFSSSGKSPNILRALETAREMGIRSLAFLGRDGGPAKGLADVELIVDNSSTARIQEAHKVLIHAICEAVELRLPKS